MIVEQVPLPTECHVLVVLLHMWRSDYLVKEHNTLRHNVESNLL